MADWTPGQVLEAADLIAAFPLAKFKTGDESLPSSTAYQDDDHLVVPVEANRDYIVEALLLFTGDPAADAKWQFTLPAGSVMSWGTFTVDSAAAIATTGASNSGSPAGNVVTGVAGTGTFRATFIRGTLEVGGTPGNLTLQWAQNVSNATATVLRRGSHLLLTRVPA